MKTLGFAHFNAKEGTYARSLDTGAFAAYSLFDNLVVVRR